MKVQKVIKRFYQTRVDVLAETKQEIFAWVYYQDVSAENRTKRLLSLSRCFQKASIYSIIKISIFRAKHSACPAMGTPDADMFFMIHTLAAHSFST